MSMISAVLQGAPTTALLKSLSSAIGGGVMDLRGDWLSGEPMVSVEMMGPEYEETAQELRDLLAWADREEVEVDLYETPVLLPPRGSRPDPIPRQQILNRIGTAADILREGHDDRP